MSTHPFYPLNLHLPSYVPPAYSIPKIFALFELVFIGPIILTYFFFLNKRIPTLSKRLSAVWFLLNCLLHAFYEGFYVIHSLGVFFQDGKGWGDALAGSTSFLAELQKEYSKADSRYFQDDTFVLAVELLTFVFQTPLVFAAFRAHVSKKPSPHFHILRLVVSLLHVSFTMLYFLTEFFRHDIDCRPEAIYYWGYLIAMNAPWVLIPTWMIWSSWNALVVDLRGAEQRKRK